MYDTTQIDARVNTRALFYSSPLFCTCGQYLSNIYMIYVKNVHNLYPLPFAELTSSKSCLSSAIIVAYTTTKYVHTLALLYMYLCLPMN